MNVKNLNERLRKLLEDSSNIEYFEIPEHNLKCLLNKSTGDIEITKYSPKYNRNLALFKYNINDKYNPANDDPLKKIILTKARNTYKN